MNVKCTWWVYTGRYTEFVGNVSSPIMRSIATGEERSSKDLPTGALWDGNADARDPSKRSEWPSEAGADGLSIICKLPGRHTWHIDGQASNCDMKDDTAHRCWVRHGTVGEELHVDKNGLTCGAGAGSISVDGYHGFLHNGELTDVPENLVRA